ncbi:MAG: hypothetical protein PHE27_01150 [Alphaproteobacteria bacterium]|nr:hypothetical protein [Alphaproteobacteria bacterium]
MSVLGFEKSELPPKLFLFKKAAYGCACQETSEEILSEAIDAFLSPMPPEEKYKAWKYLALPRDLEDPKTDLYTSSTVRLNAVVNILFHARETRNPEQALDAYAFLAGIYNVDTIVGPKGPLDKLGNDDFANVFYAVQKLDTLDKRLDACFSVKTLLTPPQTGKLFDLLMNEAFEQEFLADHAQDLLKIAKSPFLANIREKDETIAFDHYGEAALALDYEAYRLDEAMRHRANDAFIRIADATQDPSLRLDLYKSALKNPRNASLRKYALYSAYQNAEYFSDNVRFETLCEIMQSAKGSPFAFGPESADLLTKIATEVLKLSSPLSAVRPKDNARKGPKGDEHRI